MQNRAFQDGHSTKPWPESRHNSEPSDAVDAVPYPVDWSDRRRFYHFAGFVKGMAVSMGIRIRWSGDWDSDTRLDDQTFDDLPHFELMR
jgi:peptidoglycan L-alanyl-D-glutamate endopeptidase CwlK